MGYKTKKYENKFKVDPDKLQLKNYEIYRVYVETLTPVFIGSGEELNKTMYVYDNTNNKVSIIDRKGLNNFLKEKELFEDFSKESINDDFSIAKYLKGKEYDDNIFKYTLEYRDSNVILSNSKEDLNSISTFITSKNVPYIPGSSIKGAIRTAIIADSIMKNKNELKGYIENNSIEELSGFENKVIIEYILKGKNYIDKNKLFNSIHISDTKPIPIKNNDDISNFFIGTRYDYSLKGNKVVPMSIQLEFLKPNICFSFDLTINKFFSRVFSINYIINSLRNYFNLYKKCIELFPDVNSIIDGEYYNYSNKLNIPLFIGGHNGYFTKNIIYSAAKFDNNDKGVEVKDIIQKVREHIRKSDDIDDEKISPRTRRFTRYNDVYYDIGICNIKRYEKIYG